MVTPGFPENEEDTTCIPALQILVKSLKKLDVKLTVISLHYPFQSNEYRWNGIRVLPLNGKNSRFKKRFLLQSKLNHCLTNLNADTPISLLHSFWLQEASVWAGKWANKRNVPVVASAMGQDVLKENNYLKQIKQLDFKAIITLSTFHQQQLLASTGIKSQVVGLGVEDLSAFDQEEKKVDIIGVGNLISLKNYTYFIEVCAAVQKVKPTLVVKLIGVGPEEVALSQQINRLGLTNVIQLLGKQDYFTTMRWFAASKVLLHPAKFEGFGMIFTEASALRTHIASLSVGVALDLKLDSYLNGNVDHDAQLVLALLEKEPPAKENIFCDTEKLMNIYANPRKR